MKSIREIMQSNKRYAILGGRTPAENAAYWAQRHAKGDGVTWPHGPGGARRPEVVAETGNVRSHLSNCAVPGRLADVVAAGPRPTAPVLAAKAWMEGDTSFLLLHGETGGGKSLAAATTLLAMRETVRWEGGAQAQWMSHECWFLSVCELARLSYFDEEGRETVKHLKRVLLVVLDDLGAELLTPGYLSTLEDILDARFSDRRKRTVLTTNVSAARPAADIKSDFQLRYGDRIARRIRESGQVVRCEVATAAAPANNNQEAHP